MNKGYLLGAFFFILFSFVVVVAQQTVITGQLLGSDGKPMIKSHVSLIQPYGKPIALAEVSKDGSYQIATDKRGLFFLKFVGVNHKFKATLMILEGDVNNIKVNVQLETNNYLPETAFEKKPLKAIISGQSMVEFQKQSDGTYLAEVKTTKDQIEYQVSGLNLNGLPLHGTQSEDYLYDNIISYKSVVTAKESIARITLDPKKLLRSNTKSKLEVETKNPYILAATNYSANSEEKQTAYEEFIATNPSEEERQLFSQTQRQIEKEKAISTKNRLNEEKDPLLRQFLLLTYFFYSRDEADPEVVKIASNEISPASPFLSINNTMLMALLKASDKEKKEAYLSHFLAENESVNAKASMLFDLFSEAKQTKNEEEIKKYYEILIKDYNGTTFARIARTLSPEFNKLKVGMAVPEFSINSLGELNKPISNNSLKGKYYLIDFWATWCVPCVKELDGLHKAYEKFKGKNFEILSLSFDQSQEDITNFREKKWKMPWLHAFVEKAFQSEIAKNFEVFGIPRPLLINPEGKIIAVDDKLRSDELDKTLSEVLGNTAKTQ